MRPPHIHREQQSKSKTRIWILSIVNSLKFSHVESQPSIMRGKMKIKL